LVQGASRGIGLALVNALADIDRFSTIVACCRNPAAAEPLNALAGRSSGRVRVLGLDVTRPASVIAAAARVRQWELEPALVLNVAGLLHDGAAIRPERRLEDIDPIALERVFAVNVLGPAILMREFLPIMSARGRAVMAMLSARVGSISDNRLGGWYAYRSSKAALNQMVKTAAIEAARRYPGVVLAALHPGTTDTDLSAPFQARVPQGKLFAPAYVADRLLGVIDGLKSGDSGHFFAWDGSEIPW